jgi:XTP/dITP diphosphohydrolase
MELILATSNHGKLRELRELLGELPLQLLTPEELGGTLTIEEDGSTFAENALKKARAYVEWFGKAALADDGGLEVDVLDGAPGVHSKRWLGEDTPETHFAAAILKRMQGVPEADRGAQMHSAVALAMPDGRYWIEEGIVRGRIADIATEQVEAGLPYRQIFWIPESEKFYSELNADEQVQYNQRYQAMNRMVNILTKEFAS